MTATPILDLEKDPPKPRRAVWGFSAWSMARNVTGPLAASSF